MVMGWFLGVAPSSLSNDLIDRFTDWCLLEVNSATGVFGNQENKYLSYRSV